MKAMARAMYQRAPSEQQLAALGLRPEDYEEEDVEVWPEHLAVFDLWRIVGDQWRMGPCGPVSLDLAPVFHELDRMGLDKDAYEGLLMDVKVVAGVALDEMRKE